MENRKRTIIKMKKKNKQDYFNPLSLGSAALFLALVTAYFFLYNTEVYDNSRFRNSFDRPIVEAQNEPRKLAALKALQSKGLEWAHYQLVNAINDRNEEIIDLYIEGGMVLNSRSTIMESLIENPESWIALVEKLGWGNAEKLSGKFLVPRHLNKLNGEFKKIEDKYAVPHDVVFKNHYVEFKKTYDTWNVDKNALIVKVQAMCGGNVGCQTKSARGIMAEYEKTKPLAPVKDLILWQDANLTLISVASLLKEKKIVDYLTGKGVISRINKMVMSDRIEVVFKVSPEGDVSYPNGITVKELKPVGRQTEQRTGSRS